ncbi:MAG TPA: diguanylate cyclase [Solirubrobacteraceae bacterium]|nr:diguanylate cyclase [Solirubrobacteraceae bacterium]
MPKTTDNGPMGQVPAHNGPMPTQDGNHFSCSMSAVLLAEVTELAGEEAIPELLRIAASTRTPEYLCDISNWISFDEATALWRAGMQVTHNPQLPTLTGRRAARRLSASPVAALLRSLGSAENVYRQISTSASKFSTVTRLDAVDAGPGFAILTATAVDGFPRSSEHCAWTIGLLSTTTVLFGLPPAHVEHDCCAAFGAPECTYRLTWRAEESEVIDSDDQLVALRQQLDGMQERLHSMFATASDLIAADDVADVLARITDRAAMEVRAPRYLLAVRLEEDGELHVHHRGFDQGQVLQHAEEILDRHPADHPSSWLVVPVRSDRRDYGRLLAAFNTDEKFFPQERELLEVYARYAATALDGAAALIEANRRYHQSSALLQLARALATAGTSGEVAQRLAAAVPLVVDSDRVAVYLWEPARGELVRRAITTRDAEDPVAEGDLRWVPEPGGPLEQLLNDPHSEPLFIDAGAEHPRVREELDRLGDAAVTLVPLATEDTLLGVLGVSVLDRPERLAPNPDLLDRLSGVAAQASTALQNGRLVDQITHQALHDQLTGLANRLQFANQLRKAVNRARQHDELVTMFYIDLNGFKPVNDEFGHDVGDQLLSALAKRLVACVRATDLVARLGGDEFAVLITSQSSPEDSDTVAERLATAFTGPFRVDDHVVRIGASIGAAVFPVDADSADGLLRRADASMFEVKRGALGSR